MLSLAARKWRPSVRHAWLILAVVIAAQLYLFADFHWERWRSGLRLLDHPGVRSGEGLVIRCDGLGYYAWLRSLLIDRDWDFDNEFDEHNPLGDFVPPGEPRTAAGRRANLWSIGPACVWSPLVVAGHFVLNSLNTESRWPADGYSLPYQLLVGTATLLASFAGLILLYRACRRYADPGPAAIAVALLWLGTTVVFYSAIEVSMAHGVGTAAVAGLIWYWLRTYGSQRYVRWLVLGMFVGTVALMRWQLATFAILPAGENLLECHAAFRRDPRAILGSAARLALAAVGCFLGFAPQLVAWRAVFGQWLVEPFPTAHNWLTPSWSEVLFAQDRGLFYWTPMVLVACAGMWPPGKIKRDSGNGLGPRPLLLLTSACVLQVYVLASLRGERCYLGVAYGCRHLAESVVALAPGFAYLLSGLPRRRFLLVCGLGCVLVLWNLLLIAQYRYGYVPADAGADPWTLLAGAVRLVRRKRLLLLGQAVVAPGLLGVLCWRIASWKFATRSAAPETFGVISRRVVLPSACRAQKVTGLLPPKEPGRVSNVESRPSQRYDAVSASRPEARE
jgi:hypothetical protein